jgi:predicted acylesterase/phospholipase RssA
MNSKEQLPFEVLVCSGGGTKGLLFLGALKKIEELQLNNFKIFTGISVGAIIVFLYAIGFSAQEIIYLLTKTKFNKMTSISLKNILSKFGLDRGDKISAFVENSMEKKGISKNITFKTFYELKGKEFITYAANIQKKTLITFDKEQTPHLRIIDAIRMSISVPFYFTVKKFRNDILVDAGLLEHFPINLLQKYLEEKDLTGSRILGLCIKGGCKKNDNTEDNNKDLHFFWYCSCILECIVKTNFDLYKDNDLTKIVYFESDKQLLDFEMSIKEKLKLIEEGYNVTNSYFETK